MRDPSRRVQFLGDLAAMVDDDSEAQEQHRPLLEQNSAAAELHNQVCAIAAELGAAGCDFTPSLDFRRKLDEELKARRAGRPHRADSREHTLPMLALPQVAKHHRGPRVDSPQNGATQADTQQIEIVRLDSTGMPIPSKTPSSPAASSLPAPPCRSPNRSLPTNRPWLRPLAMGLIPTLVIAALWSTGRFNLTAPPQAAIPNSPAASIASAPSTAQSAPPPFLLTPIQNGSLGVRRTDKNGEPLPWSPNLHPGEQVITGAASLCNIQTPSGEALILGRRSRLSLTEQGEVMLTGTLQVGGASRIPAQALAFLTPHGRLETTPSHRHALWMLKSSPLHTQVAVFSGQVSLESPHGGRKLIEPHTEMLIPLRGVPTTASFVDASAWFPHFRTRLPGHGFGRLRVQGRSTPVFPETHQTHIQIGAGHALFETAETFNDVQGEHIEYELPLPSQATALSTTQQLGLDRSPAVSSQTITENGQTSVVRIRLQSQTGQLTLTSHYLVALQRDSLGQYRGYNLVPPAVGAHPDVTIHANAIDPGELVFSGAARAQRGKSLTLKPPQNEPFNLRIAFNPASPATDGSVRWSTWSRDPANAAEAPPTANNPLGGRLPNTPPQAALFIAPAPTRVPATPRHFVIVIDRSKSVGPGREVTVHELLNQLSLESPTNTRISTLVCTHDCSTWFANQEVEGSRLLDTPPVPASPRNGVFSFEAAVQAATALAQTYVKPPSALKADLVLITDAAQSDITADQLKKRIGPGKVLGSLTILLTGGPRRQRYIEQLTIGAGGASFGLSTVQEAQILGHALAEHAYHPPLRGTQLQLSDGRAPPSRFSISPPKTAGTWVPIPEFTLGMDQALMSGRRDGAPVLTPYTLGLAPGHPNHPPLAALFQQQAGLGLPDGPFAARALASPTDTSSELRPLEELLDALTLKNSAPATQGSIVGETDDYQAPPTSPCSDVPITACVEQWTALVKRHPDDKRVWLSLAATQLQSARPATALQTLSDVADLWEGDARLHAIAGEHLRTAGETDWACAHLLRAAQLSPVIYALQAELCYAAWHAAPQQ